MVRFFEVFKRVLKDWLEEHWDVLKEGTCTWEITYPYMLEQIEVQKLLDALEEYEARKPGGVGLRTYYNRMGEVTYFFNPQDSDIYVAFDGLSFKVNPEIIGWLIRELAYHVHEFNLEAILQGHYEVNDFVSDILENKLDVQCDGAIVSFEVVSDQETEQYWEIDICIGIGFLNNLLE